MLDIGPCGANGDKGCDGSTLETRINRYVTLLSGSEILILTKLGENTMDEVFQRLLIDD